VALAGTGLVLERQRDRTGPSCLLRHLGWGTESRARECPGLADLMTKESQHCRCFGPGRRILPAAP